jgi:hypothetical protein
MRVITIAVLFFVLTASAHAQNLTVNSVNLSLGESEIKARADLTSAGMKIQELGADSYVVTAKRGEIYDLVGAIAFVKGKVTWIQRDWYMNETPNDKNTLANIFYSAAASLLEGNEQANCTINVKTQDTSPSSGISKVTTIQCVRPSHVHALVMMGVDCSAGCSIGNISGALTESIKQNQE